MSQQVCLVTGANRGIGLAVATRLAQQQASVVMICRDQVQATRAKAQVRQAAGHERVEVALADLSSLRAVRQLAAELHARFPVMHVLIHNAGLALPQRTLTVDGLETTFVVNYLAPFLLTKLLLPDLQRSAPARILSVSSLVHRWGKLDFADLQGQEHYSMDRAYNQSKLAQVVWTQELARRLDAREVTINSLEPGMTATDFGRHYTGFKGLMNRLYRPLMNTPEEVARHITGLALAPEWAGQTGRHVLNGKVIQPSKASLDQEQARQLWEVSLQLTQEAPHE